MKTGGSDMTNNQRVNVISSIKQLLGLVGENAAPQTMTAVVAVIIELSRLEDLLTQKHDNRQHQDRRFRFNDASFAKLSSA
jgi:hypothetical protein